ncbi:type II secretion system protein [Microbacterium oleivorans]|uniref:type II secretion system protein n=1 Tax=Microbacterium oleivorans TaxID=273677 RepID=UPI002559DBF5|nr:prepilin-type N-terminal cleavage/methylation domain-containing protein [Microbacterium oleivorans]
MKNYLDALKRRKEETGESGFSLIELIVVVVILGILAAIAVPVFMGLQDQANRGTLETAIANGASQAAADFAQGETPTSESLSNLNTDGVVLTITPATGATIENFCVTGTKSGYSAPADDPIEGSGPGC